MNKKNIFIFAMLIAVAGILGYVGISRVSAQDSAATSASIDNANPAFTVNTAESWLQAYLGTGTKDSRAESSTTYPTNMGSIVTFTATATDSNADDYYMIVCDGTDITPVNNSAPTCGTDTIICVSSSTASGSAATCPHSTGVEANETYNWYSYVCDHNAASTCSGASTTSQGGTHAEVGSTPTPAGSPYHVNHVPTFTAAAISAVNPGVTVTFANSADADSDSNGTQDTFDLYVCSGESDQGGVSAFDARAKTCSGGLTLCTDLANGTGEQATCTEASVFLTSIPTAHATDYTVKFYVLDNHGFASILSPDNDFAVNDVAPVLTSYTTTDVPVPAAGTSDDVTYAVAFADDNGDNDPTSLDFIFFEATNESDLCTADDNDCIRIDSINPSSLPGNCSVGGTLSSPVAGKLAQGADKDITLSCDFTTWFNIEAGDNWEVAAFASDGTTTDVNFADSTANIIVPELVAIGITESTIAYGALSTGATSTYDDLTTRTDIENQGNQTFDVLIDGIDMTDAGNTIPAAQQKWNYGAAPFTWASAGNAMLTTAIDGAEVNGCLNADLAVRAVHGTGTEDESVAWIIQIPASQASGSYTGTNTFEFNGISDCSGPLH